MHLLKSIPAFAPWSVALLLASCGAKSNTTCTEANRVAPQCAPVPETTTANGNVLPLVAPPAAVPSTHLPAVVPAQPAAQPGAAKPDPTAKPLPADPVVTPAPLPPQPLVPEPKPTMPGVKTNDPAKQPAPVKASEPAVKTTKSGPVDALTPDLDAEQAAALEALPQD